MKLTTIIIILCFGAAKLLSQTTNSIPKDLYLTDDGAVFWYKHKERLVSSRKIEEAKSLRESLPADVFTEGNWGVATNGLQLSLRFEKQFFTNGEPIVATLLLRNITNTNVVIHQFYISQQPSPVNILAFQNQNQIPVKSSGGAIDVISSREFFLYPQTQRKYRIVLNGFYDLSSDGEYFFQAAFSSMSIVITSQKVPIKIVSGQ